MDKLVKKASKASKRFFNMNGNDANSDSSQDFDIPGVYNELFFYGRITRLEAESILRVNGMQDGLYLLRESITPMGNFSLSMVHNGEVVHYAIEKQVEGRFQISEGKSFTDPKSLIEYYQEAKTGFLSMPKFPCLRTSSQQAIAFRGLSYKDLHLFMEKAAKKENANMGKAFGPMRETLLLHVLKTQHIHMPWFHGGITREEGNERLRTEGHRDGLFLIRTRSDGDSFALTLSHEGSLRHYVIVINDGENYSIESGSRFKALIILIDHYHNKRDGLPCRLTSAVPNPDVTHQGWKEYNSLSQKLTQQPGCQLPRLPKRVPPPPPGDSTGSDLPTHQAPPPPTPPPRGASAQVDLADDDECIEDQGPEKIVTDEEAHEQEQIYGEIRNYVVNIGVNPDQVTLGDKIGSGQFGEVRRGVCVIKGKNVPVAVKTLKSENPQAEEEIMKEADTMKSLDHQHIVRFIGFCKGESLMLVLELAALGTLKKYLPKHKDMKAWHLLELATQICDGMKYLESQAFVHRDLATRNVLLLNEHFCKISDFGLSRPMDDNSEYYQAHAPGKWPLLWYAPECLLFHKFDSKSDVWSFGITLWEIMAFGARPYSEMKGLPPAEILNKIEYGQRMSKPAQCDDRIYELMMQCWEWNKKHRPSFEDLYPKMAELWKTFKKKKM